MSLFFHQMIARSRLLLIIALIVTASAVLGSVLYLKTKSGILDLYNKEDPLYQRYFTYIQEFGTTEDLVVVVEKKNPSEKNETLHTALNQLATRLSAKTDLVRSVYHRLDFRAIETHGLYFLNQDAQRDLGIRMQSSREPFYTLLRENKPHAFFAHLARDMALGKGDAKHAKDDLARLNALMTTFRASAETGHTPDAPWKPFLQTGATPKADIFDDAGYIRATPEMYLLFVRPIDITNNTEKTKALVDMARSELAQLFSEFPTLSGGVTGAPALNSDQFSIAEVDMTLSSIFSFIAVALVFMVSFGEWRRPFFSMISLAIGIAWTFGLTTLAIGHINLFSMAFATMVIGLGMDFGVHFVSRYEEELGEGLGSERALVATLRHTGRSIGIGALTNAAAFWTTLFVDLKGFAELGLIAGTGIMLSMLATFVVLPPLLYLKDRKKSPEQLALPILNKLALRAEKAARGRTPIFDAFGSWVNRHTRALSLLIVGVSFLAVFALLGPYAKFGFDYNLLNLQAKNSEAVRYEHKLVDAHLSPRHAIWLPPETATDHEIREKIKAFEALQTVDRVESITSLLPENMSETHAFLQTLKLHYPNAVPLQASSTSEWRSALIEFKIALSTIKNKAFRAGKPELLSEIDGLEQANAGLLRVLDVTNTSINPPYPPLSKGDKNAVASQESTPLYKQDPFAPFSESFIGGFRHFFANALQSKPITLSDYPDEIKNRFISASGARAIYIVPKISIWERPELERFVSELRGVEPTITGNPIQMYDTLERVRAGYTKSGVYALIIVFLIALVDFRNVKQALICTTTVLLGMLWLFGVMSAFGLQFNMANLIAVPLTLGLGIDNSIHLFHRYRETGDWSDVFRNTGRAVSITTFTNLLGFVGMALSRHQGLASMGQILVLGLSLCFIAAMTVLPVLTGRKKAF